MKRATETQRTIDTESSDMTTIRKALAKIRRSRKEFSGFAGEWRWDGGDIWLDDGGYIQVKPMSATHPQGAILVGCFVAVRYDRNNNFVSEYHI